MFHLCSSTLCNMRAVAEWKFTHFIILPINNFKENVKSLGNIKSILSCFLFIIVWYFCYFCQQWNLSGAICKTLSRQYSNSRLLLSIQFSKDTQKSLAILYWSDRSPGFEIVKLRLYVRIKKPFQTVQLRDKRTKREGLMLGSGFLEKAQIWLRHHKHICFNAFNKNKNCSSASVLFLYNNGTVKDLKKMSLLNEILLFMYPVCYS